MNSNELRDDYRTRLHSVSMPHEADGVVSLWLGSLDDAEVDHYFREQYENDVAPISLFAADFGFSFYDHDFLEVNHVSRPTEPEQLFATLSFSSSFIDAAVAAARHFQIETANTAVAIFDFSFTDRGRRSHRIQFIGSFRYDRTARQVREPVFT